MPGPNIPSCWLPILTKPFIPNTFNRVSLEILKARNAIRLIHQAEIIVGPCGKSDITFSIADAREAQPVRGVRSDIIQQQIRGDIVDNIRYRNICFPALNIITINQSTFATFRITYKSLELLPLPVKYPSWYLICSGKMTASGQNASSNMQIQKALTKIRNQLRLSFSMSTRKWFSLTHTSNKYKNAVSTVEAAHVLHLVEQFIVDSWLFVCFYNVFETI